MQERDRREWTDRLVSAAEYLNRRTLSERLEAWAQLGMTTPQVKTLVFLDERGPARMGMIASHLGTSLSATTSVVDRLVQKGMLDRASDPTDRRVVVCELTSGGRDAVDRFWRLGEERLVPAAEQLGSEDLRAVVHGLELLRGAAESVYQQAAEEQADS
jgi:DNA-binding MarR family transcriptional regulator